MTLKELQSKIERTSGKELPTAAKLRSGISPLVICRDFDGSAQLSVYKNGFALYQSLGRSTVFRVDACGGYTYFGRTEKSELDEKFFRDTEWWVRLMMEGEDRLTHNQTSLAERHESLYETSIDTAADTEDFLKNIILRETLEAAFSLMTERQREIVVMYYIDGMGVKEIAAIYGITHQAVSVTLSDVKKKFRENRNKFEKPVIKETINPDRTTLTLNIEYEGNGGNIATNGLDVGKYSDRTIRTDTQTTTQTPQTTIRTINEDTEEKILFLIKRNPRITQVQLASELNVPTSTIKYYIRKLSKAQVIKREGTVHNGQWIVL